jgi:hypothetical protein
MSASLTLGGSNRFPTPAHPSIVNKSKKTEMKILSDRKILIGHPFKQNL